MFICFLILAVRWEMRGRYGTVRYVSGCINNRAGGLYRRILTKVTSPDRTQWGVYQRPRSRFSHTDRPSSLRRCLLYGQTRKQRNKNINNFICFPARAQAFSWLSSVTGLQSKRNKNNCLKSSFVQTLYKQANLFIFFVCNFLRRTVTTRSV